MGLRNMTSLKASERHSAILERLNATGRIDVLELVSELGVSSVTIRSDLLYLEKGHLLRRIRGGAVAVRLSRYERPVDINSSLHADEKAAIAAAAAKMIHDGETIILDSGSTVEALADSLPLNLGNIAVVTNSMNIAGRMVDHPGATVIVTGGTMRPKVNSLISPLGDLILREINADIAFVSCAGVDAEKGFTNSNWHEAEIKRAIIRAASRVVFLADHSKLKHIATARIIGIDEADLLITDNKASAETVRELRAAGLEVVVAS